MLAWSCTDTFEPDIEGGGTFDGSIRPLSVELAFEPSAESHLQSRAEETMGDAIQDINSLRLFIYDEQGALLNTYHIVEGGNGRETPGVISNVNCMKDQDNRLPGESDLQDDASGRVTFNFNLRTGRYYIYALANADDLTPEQYATREALKAVSRPWVSGNIAANSEMFGIFSGAPDRGAAAADRPVAVTSEVVKMHCWLRRLASKVTVAFDGSELYDNVQVFIESVALHDIPRNCTLGSPNTPGRDASSLDATAMLPPSQRYSAANGVIADGDIDVLQDLKSNGLLTPGNYMHVCNNAHRYFGKGDDNSDSEADLSRRHAMTARSLFFYENMQGKGPAGCKLQDADGDNRIDNPDPVEGNLDSGWKDGKAYGTYVEVKGWYRCSAVDGHVGQGPIIYRFMLGKDTDSDFDAERNHHYRLTLRFKGYGNDADWHIVYSHSGSIQVASPQYVSYLFNKKMMATVKINGRIPDGCFLKAEIVDNGWEPWGDGSDDFPDVTPGFVSPVDLGYTKKNQNYLGFLSLNQTNVVKIEKKGLEGVPSSAYNATTASSTLYDNYYGESKGVRYYSIEPGNHDSNDKGKKGRYLVEASLYDTQDHIVERVYNIPLYTRAKELVTWTGFTGNNPFNEYPRHAKIQFTVVDGNTDAAKPVKGFESVELDVVQVRRVENPKGVWRSMSNNDPFHVTLRRRPNEKSKQFKEFKSIGKWSAEVLTGHGQPQVVTLSTTEKGSGTGNRPQNMVTRIEGENECPIDFIINFTGAKGCSVIRVRYHDFTCEHDIFCRKGYEDEIDVVGDGKLLWSTMNVHHFEGKKPVMTKNPAQEGSLFRHVSYEAILASNNKDYGFGVVPGSLNMRLSSSKDGTQTWGAMGYSNGTSTKDEDGLAYYKWPVTGGNEGWRLPTGKDFYTFISDDASNIDFNISKAYGVIYCDGATETKEEEADACGYDDENGGDSEKGMRGVFVYNNKTFAQIFFPIGMTGYGHRKQAENGILRYAGRTAICDPVKDKTLLTYRPMFYRLFEYPGAIYWLEHYYEKIPKKTHVDGKQYEEYTYSSAFDMNYYTMGFEGYGLNATYGKSDACFIRLVRPAK